MKIYNDKKEDSVYPKREWRFNNFLSTTESPLILNTIKEKGVNIIKEHIIWITLFLLMIIYTKHTYLA